MDKREELNNSFGELRRNISNFDNKIIELKDAYEQAMTEIKGKPYKIPHTQTLAKSASFFKSFECSVCGKKSKIIKTILYHKHIKKGKPSKDVMTLAEFCKKR